MSEKDRLVFLHHMFESIADVEDSFGGIEKKDFFEDKEKIDATVRRIEVLGEAAKNLSEDFKETHPEVPWKEIIGTRDRMIHAYFKVNLDLVWEIVQQHLPELKQQLEKIIAAEGEK
tara:strand:+ start:465 stop:815 length:351 start_codon:yes stop_codon:yes gene_type:complete